MSKNIATIQDVYSVIRKQHFAKMRLSIKELSPETRIVSDLGADSLDAMELAMECESVFDITVSDEEIARVDSIADLYDLVIAKQKEVL